MIVNRNMYFTFVSKSIQMIHIRILVKGLPWYDCPIYQLKNSFAQEKIVKESMLSKWAKDTECEVVETNEKLLISDIYGV